MSDGQRLLELFRKEQEKRGNIGCLCDDCIKDMDTAHKIFKSETTLE